MKTWNELTRLEQYQITYSDMYKDAHGFRPQLNPTMTFEDYEAEFENLSALIIAEEESRIAVEARKADQFERRVQELLTCGAKDRTMALRWIHEAEGTNGDDEYLCYMMGLAYNYFKA